MTDDTTTQTSDNAATDATPPEALDASPPTAAEAAAPVVAAPEKPHDPRPYLVLTAIVDSSARAAAVTRSHGDALERALAAAEGFDLAGLDVIELPIMPHSFAALRKQMQLPEDTVAMYDLFPLSAHLDGPVRKVAGQFLAAEILWALDEQGLFQGVPLTFRLDVPRGWDRSPKDVHGKLLEAGALNLSEGAIDTFKSVKNGYDARRSGTA